MSTVPGQIVLTQAEFDAIMAATSKVQQAEVSRLLKCAIEIVNEKRCGDPIGTIRRCKQTGALAERIEWRDLFGDQYLAWRVTQDGKQIGVRFDDNLDRAAWPIIHHGVSWFHQAVEAAEPVKESA